MSRRYTDQEMREMALTIEHKREICSVEDSGDTDDRGCKIFYHKSHYDECQIIATMLRQAADDLESKEKRERKYEYAEKFITESVSNFHHDTYMEAKGDTVDGYRIVRREIGEWEEVKGV